MSDDPSNLEKPPCPACGNPVVRRPKEKPYEFKKRRFCSQPCAARTIGVRPRTQEEREAMSKFAQKRGQDPEYRAKLVAAHERRKAAGTWQDTYDKWQAGYRAARANPEKEQQRAAKYVQSMTERGVYARNRERLKAFYATPEGEVAKERIRQFFTGKPRPVEVVEKVRISARKFFDSPAGWRLREAMSKNRTGDLPNAPYGPGWSLLAARVRSRDGQKCCICDATQDTLKRMLDVHHIYPRRLFGYIPGENRMYLWANHLANLVTLCGPCHMQVEMKSATVPSSHQARADELWREFSKYLTQ